MIRVISILIIVVIGSCKESKQEASNDLVDESKQKIAFVTDRDGNYEIYVMDVDGKNLANLTNNDSLDFSPSWSSENSQLYFYSKRDGNAEIYSLDLESKKASRLTNHQATDVLPITSPNGKLILFISNRDSLSRSVYVMKKDGSSVKSLTKNTLYEESPDWSPSGQKVIFTRQLRDPNDTSHAANGEIHMMNSDGSNVKRLTSKPGYDSGAKFSPDGKKIAFYGIDNNQWDLYIMDSDGSNLYNLTNDSIECYSPNWSPDGKWLVYTAGENGVYNIWKINIESKTRIQLTNTIGRNVGPVWIK